MTAISENYINFFASFISSLDGVYAFCEAMPDPEVADGQLEALGRWMDLTQGIECRDFSYSSLVETLSNTAANSPTAIMGRMFPAIFQNLQSHFQIHLCL